MSLCPPKKRDWIPGTPQIGTFLRTAQGSVIEASMDRATEDEQLFCLVLATGSVRKLPTEVLDGVRAFWDAQKEKNK